MLESLLMGAHAVSIPCLRPHQWRFVHSKLPPPTPGSVPKGVISFSSFHGEESSRVCNEKAKEASQDLEGKLVAILGLGASGRAAVKLAVARGAKIVAIDSNEMMPPLQEDPQLAGLDFSRIQVELGTTDLHSINDADRIVVSPGISLEKYNLHNLVRMGKPVVSELEFAAESLPREVKIIAVTGTNGKSTVATFTGQILQEAGISSFIGGNLGLPLSDAALQCLESQTDIPLFQAAVVEVSSYQMEIPGYKFLPSVAAVLNLTPDHLERHKTLNNYGACKCRLFSHMEPSNLAIIPKNDLLLEELAFQAGGQGTRAWLGDFPGVQLDSTAQFASILVPTTGVRAYLDLRLLKTVGVHNAYNAATAALLALGLDLGLDEDIVQSSLSMLRPPPHRMQIVCQDDNGVLWIDDSKATNVEATYTGLKGFTKQQAVVLLGGLPKFLNNEGDIGFDRLVEVLQPHKAVITFGAAGVMIKEDLERAGLSLPCTVTKSLQEAVHLAKIFAQHGNAILLSPGCASFDEFQNFEHRGKAFCNLARSFL